MLVNVITQQQIIINIKTKEIYYIYIYIYNLYVCVYCVYL